MQNLNFIFLCYRFVHLELVVQGRMLQVTLESDPDLAYSFEWDKRDLFGHKVFGRTEVLIKAGYQYSDCQGIQWEKKVSSRLYIII